MQRLTVAMLGLALAGCAVLRSESLAVHGIPLDPVPARTAKPLAVQVLVEAPRAADPIGDIRVVLVGADGEYAVLPGVRWREAPPEMFRSLLLESIERSGAVTSAARTSAALSGDFLLETELRHFELVESGDAPAQARAEASVTIVRLRDGRAVGTRRLEAVVPVADRSTKAGIDALAAAMNAIVARAHDDVVEALAALR